MIQGTIWKISNYIFFSFLIPFLDFNDVSSQLIKIGSVKEMLKLRNIRLEFIEIASN